MTTRACGLRNPYANDASPRKASRRVLGAAAVAVVAAGLGTAAAQAYEIPDGELQFDPDEIGDLVVGDGMADKHAFSSSWMFVDLDPDRYAGLDGGDTLSHFVDGNPQRDLTGGADGRPVDHLAIYDVDDDPLTAFDTRVSEGIHEHLQIVPYNLQQTDRNVVHEVTDDRPLIALVVTDESSGSSAAARPLLDDLPDGGTEGLGERSPSVDGAELVAKQPGRNTVRPTCVQVTALSHFCVDVGRQPVRVVRPQRVKVPTVDPRWFRPPAGGTSRRAEAPGLPDTVLAGNDLGGGTLIATDARPVEQDGMLAFSPALELLTAASDGSSTVDRHPG